MLEARPLTDRSRVELNGIIKAPYVVWEPWAYALVALFADEPPLPVRPTPPSEPSIQPTGHQRSVLPLQPQQP